MLICGGDITDCPYEVRSPDTFEWDTIANISSVTPNDTPEQLASLTHLESKEKADDMVLRGVVQTYLPLFGFDREKCSPYF